MGQSHRNLWWAGDVPMTAIERTAYPRFTRAPSVKELREIYTPTPGDIAFVATRARGPSQKFALMILLKVYQRILARLSQKPSSRSSRPSCRLQKKVLRSPLLLGSRNPPRVQP